MKKLLSALLFATLCFSISVPAFAASASQIDYSVPEYLSAFIANRNEDASISQVVPMYNTEDTVIAWLYVLDPVGYVVEDASHEIVVEFSFCNSFNYTEGDTLYYGGPTQFYQKDSGSFYNVKSDVAVSDGEVAEKSLAFATTTASLIENADSTLSLLANTPPYSLDKNEFQLYEYNPDGRCGSVAAAILLAYYNDNGYSGLVPSTYYNSDVRFTNYLMPHIEGLDAESGSSTNDLVSGLNWYLQQKNFDSKLAAYSKANGSFSTYTGKIDGGDPVILDLDAEPTYGEHWVVGYGYDYDQFIVQYNQFAIVDDGWGDVEISINWKYVGDLVYLKAE